MSRSNGLLVQSSNFENQFKINKTDKTPKTSSNRIATTSNLAKSENFKNTNFGTSKTSIDLYQMQSLGGYVLIDFVYLHLKKKKIFVDLIVDKNKAVNRRNSSYKVIFNKINLFIKLKKY